MIARVEFTLALRDVASYGGRIERVLSPRFIKWPVKSAPAVDQGRSQTRLLAHDATGREVPRTVKTPVEERATPAAAWHAMPVPHGSRNRASRLRSWKPAGRFGERLLSRLRPALLGDQPPTRRQCRATNAS